METIRLRDEVAFSPELSNIAALKKKCAKELTKEEVNQVQFYLTDLVSRFIALDKSRGLENYYLSYSGGKDSHFLLWFIKNMIRDDHIKIVSCNTTLEHQEIRERMYKYADEILLPELTPLEIKKQYGSPCFTKIQDEFIMRYQNGCRSASLMGHINGMTFTERDGKQHRSSFCLNRKAREYTLSGKLHKVSPKCCYYLKKKPFRGYEKKTGKKAILGVRGKESKLRASQYKGCLHKNGQFTPLWDLDDKLLNLIYALYDIEIPKIYEHVDRTGCIGCPYGARYGETEKELKLLNEVQRAYVAKLFRESYEVLGVNYKE